MKGMEWAQRWARGLEKYKYVLLVLLAGAVLLLWPSPAEKGEAPQADESAQADLFETAALEEKLEKALSQVEGAGEVRVVLTLDGGPRRVLAQDADDRESDTEVQRETSVVLASQGSGVEEPVAVQQLGPRYRGALVVASGGGDPQVKLALTQAVSALTGLGVDKISICKGK